MTKQFLSIFLSLIILILCSTISAYAVPDGKGNELFPKENVGIGTMTPIGGLAVMNGNVGLGTWIPLSALQVVGGTTTLYDAGSTGSIPLDIGGNLRLVRNEVNSAGVGHLQVDGTSGNSGNYTLEAASNSGWIDVATFSYSGFGVPSKLEAADVYANASAGSGNGSLIFANGGGDSAGYEFRALSNNRNLMIQGDHTNSNPTWSSTYLTINNPSGNVGIGTTTPIGGLTVMNGNVGIGTWVPGGALEIEGGNVGIGSTAPGKTLDVNGTVRATAFVGNGAQLTGIAANNWVDVTTTTQSMATNTGYIADDASLVTLTLPGTAAVGTEITIIGGVSGTGLWKVAQNSGQTIHFGSINTTTGTGGYLSSTSQYDSVQLLCIKADTDFVVISSQGNITWN